MTQKITHVNVDILVKRGDKILLGLLKQWKEGNMPLYGMPGSDVHFGEPIGDAIRRNVREELGCGLTSYDIIAVNANYEFGNHYIGIGCIADIDGEPEVMQKDDWVSWEWFHIDAIPDNLFTAAKSLLKCLKEKKVCVSE
jgi:8-oxo-dGTP diphosphatase